MSEFNRRENDYRELEQSDSDNESHSSVSSTSSNKRGRGKDYGTGVEYDTAKAAEDSVNGEWRTDGGRKKTARGYKQNYQCRGVPKGRPRGSRGAARGGQAIAHTGIFLHIVLVLVLSHNSCFFFFKYFALMTLKIGRKRLQMVFQMCQ